MPIIAVKFGFSQKLKELSEIVLVEILKNLMTDIFIKESHKYVLPEAKNFNCSGLGSFTLENRSSTTKKCFIRKP